MLISPSCKLHIIDKNEEYIGVSNDIFEDSMKEILDSINQILITNKVNNDIEKYPCKRDKLIKLYLTKVYKISEGKLWIINLNDIYNSVSDKLDELVTKGYVEIIDVDKINDVVLDEYQEYMSEYPIEPYVFLMKLEVLGAIKTIERKELYIYLSMYTDYITYEPTESITTYFDYDGYRYYVNDIKSLFSYVFSDMMQLSNINGYIFECVANVSYNISIIDYFILNKDEYINNKDFYYSIFTENKYYIHLEKSNKTIQIEYAVKKEKYFDNLDLSIFITSYTDDINNISKMISENQEYIIKEIARQIYPDPIVIQNYVFIPICSITLSNFFINEIYQKRGNISNETVIVSKYMTHDEILSTRYQNINL